jgi:hypothetical protein
MRAQEEAMPVMCGTQGDRFGVGGEAYLTSWMIRFALKKN